MANVLIFGDSISYGCWDEKGGWAQRLKNEMEQDIIASHFAQDHFIYPLGIPGDTTQTLLQRFKQETDARIIPQERTIFIFSIGINDSIYNNKTNSFITPLWKFKNNLQALMQAAKRYTKDIIVVGLTPVDETKVNPMSWLPECSYKNDYISQYTTALEEVCTQEKLIFLDVFTDWQHKEFEKLLLDGLHPNSEGHSLLLEKIREKVKDF